MWFLEGATQNDPKCLILGGGDAKSCCQKINKVKACRNPDVPAMFNPLFHGDSDPLEVNPLLKANSRLDAMMVAVRGSSRSRAFSPK